MSDINRTILGSKDGIIGHLAEHLAWARERGSDAPTQRDRQHYRGMVEGLEYAISALQDWDLEQSIHDADEALTAAGLDGEQPNYRHTRSCVCGREFTTSSGATLHRKACAEYMAHQAKQFEASRRYNAEKRARLEHRNG